MSETGEFIVSIPFFEGGFVSTEYASTALLFPDRQLCVKKGLERKMNVGFFVAVLLQINCNGYSCD